MQSQVTSVGLLANALAEQKGSAIIEMLSNMSADEILKCDNNSGTVLSTLVEALFAPAEDTSFSLEKAWAKMRKGICDSFIASASIESTGFVNDVRRKVDHLMGTPSGAKADNEDVSQQKDDSANRAVSSDLVGIIAKGIKIVAQKLEDARVAAEREGPETYAEYCDTVAKYLQGENVTYVFNGVEYRRSCIYAASLQYLFYTSDPERQESLLEPLKELLLGFSRYPLDSNKAHSLHYALSLSGGVNEDLFIENVLKPLFSEESRKRGKGVSADDSVIRDSAGNTLLHYALSSVYCSSKTMSLVIEEFGARGHDSLGKDDLSLLEILANNIPYYCLFFSLGDTVKGHKALSNANKALKKATAAANFADMRQALGKRTDELYKMHVKAHEVSSSFGAALKLLCHDDEKVRKAEEFATLYEDDKCWYFKIPEILSEYKVLLNRVREISNAFTDENDQLLGDNLREILSACDGRRKLIGSVSAASEVAKAVLRDRRYVRRIGVTAACARSSADENVNNEGTARLSSGWEYDSHSWGVNRFFGMMCTMCKWTAFSIEDFCTLHDVTREAMLVYRSEKRLYSRVTKVMFVTLWVLSFVAVLGNALSIFLGYHANVLYVVNAVVTLIAVAMVAAIVVCNRGLVEAEYSIKVLQDSFAEYVERFWRQREEENIDCPEQDGGTYIDMEELGASSSVIKAEPLNSPGPVLTSGVYASDTANSEQLSSRQENQTSTLEVSLALARADGSNRAVRKL